MCDQISTLACTTTAPLLWRFSCFLCLALAFVTGCASHDAGVVTDADAALQCQADAASATGARPAQDSGACAPGFWLNSGRACGPGLSPNYCHATGDGLCYRLCATSDDCPDPCAPACADMQYFAGGDTASRMPVCQAGDVTHFPASCESAVRGCVADCQGGELSSQCVKACRDSVQRCAYETCLSEFEVCSQECATMLPDDQSRVECNDSCTVEQTICRWGKA